MRVDWVRREELMVGSLGRELRAVSYGRVSRSYQAEEDLGRLPPSNWFNAFPGCSLLTCSFFWLHPALRYQSRVNINPSELNAQLSRDLSLGTRGLVPPSRPNQYLDWKVYFRLAFGRVPNEKTCVWGWIAEL